VHRYSLLLQWSVPLGQQGHMAMVPPFSPTTVYSVFLDMWRDFTAYPIFPLVFGSHPITDNYRISWPIRRTFFPQKCDLSLNCVLYAEGKYLFPNL
jgi:hypothetical protein